MELRTSDVPNRILSGDPGSFRVGLRASALPSEATCKAPEANQPPVGFPRDLCVHELLQAGARQDPNAAAVQFRHLSLTYCELDARSNQLARFLRNKGIGPEVLVGVCLERSIEMVVALLGVLKAGGAYVPVDPAYPSDRIQYVFDDARIPLLLTQDALVSNLPATSAEVVCLDPDWKAFCTEDSARVETNVRPENLAYVIYTSGSTGKPKGVQIEHRSAVNFLCSMRKRPGMTATDVLVAVTTLSFDISGLELYLPLLVGGRLVIASGDATSDGRLLMQLLEKSGASIMQATPTTWRILLESGWKGNSALKALVGGEALSVDLARQLAVHCGSVWNMYGPTETTIWSSVYKVEGKDEKLVPIGQPVANTTFYVLDDKLRPVAAGAEGELYIGGEGLARGYFERAELTAEKFVCNPFSSQPGARMYRTGDLVRYKPDGNVEFLGRIDHQVKIRGFRIELGEIEAVLEQHSGIRHAVVIAREDVPGDKRLVAYYVPETRGALTGSKLREHLARQLPDYMIPSAFVLMEKLPLTPNGKVDRKALAAPTAQDFASQSEYVAPRNATERKLVELWETVLGMSPISVTANFFDLGGRSVLAARLFTKILRTFGKELPLSTLFRAPTVEQLAKELDPSAAIEEYQTLVPIQVRGSGPAFFCVHGGAGSTLFLQQLSRKLGTGHPFYGLEPEGLDGNRFRRRTVEDMAAHYVAEIRKVQPNGPYYLGGYCFGGLVAFEMAQLLRRQHQEAALVALFSAELRCNHLLPRPSLALAAQLATAQAKKMLRSPVRALQTKSKELYWHVREFVENQMFRILLGMGFRIPPAMRTKYVAYTLRRAEWKYRPKPYPGSIVLFYGRASSEYGPNLGWEGLAEAFGHHVIGDEILDSRRDIMNEPLVGITAKELAPYFAAASEDTLAHAALDGD
jgi:amino acid adenylation domain-containing protein